MLKGQCIPDMRQGSQTILEKYQHLKSLTEYFIIIIIHVDSELWPHPGANLATWLHIPNMRQVP